MNKLLQEMMQQMTKLQEKVDAIQKIPQVDLKQESDEEAEGDTGGLLQLTEVIKTFLEAVFSSTMTNADASQGDKGT